MKMIINVLSLILSISSLIFAYYTFLKTESLRRRVRINLNQIIDDARLFLDELRGKVDDLIYKRYRGIQDSMIKNLLSIDEKLATQWVNKNIPYEKWPKWEVHLQINMKKYRKLRNKKG